jgi:aconitate hydratase 2/2-methylisocitrate dehydratase
MKNMIADGYADARTHWRAASRRWKPGWPTRSCCKADADAEYAAVIEIDLADINEPHRVLPERPGRRQDRSREVAGAKIDEVFIGSCMTNIGHFRAASKLLEGKRDIPVKLWMAPPDQDGRATSSPKEGHYGVFGTAGARMEMPGCSAVHGQPGAGERGRDGDVHLAPATSPTVWARTPMCTWARPSWQRFVPSWVAFRPQAEYLADMGVINADGSKIYKYMNFDQIDEFVETAKGVTA